LYLSLPESGIRVGEIRGTAEHGDTLAMIFHAPPEYRPVGFIPHLQEAGIPFQAFHLKTYGKIDPFMQFHAAIFAQRIHKSFGKNS
jgi:hypothetical protein